MARAAASSALEDLDLSGEEVQRLTSAFRDPEFRRMFSELASEMTDPENRRRYEEEVTALERERGVEVRFVHPEPGHVLRTSLDGQHRCYVNVCSNPLVGSPSSRPSSADTGTAAGRHWSLPYSLAPGRRYAGRGGSRYTVYDVVFHPDALALAAEHERFRAMLDDTALQAVERQFGVTLDRRNARALKTKYKGVPEAAVLRTPLPGGAPAQPDQPDGETPAGLLPPYPYRCPAGRAPDPPGPPEPPPGPPQASPPPTEPRCTVLHRHHVDLQDYRCSRDSAPSPVPHELVVTIELPLLRSADGAELEVTGKLLRLDSRNPDYRLRLPLPYPVDDGRGTARYNRARRQLVVTLPVVARRDGAGSDDAVCDSRDDLAGTREEAGAGAGSDDGAGTREEAARRDGAGSDDAACASRDDLTGTREEPARGVRGAADAGAERVPEAASVGLEAMGGPGAEAEGVGALCPPLQCRQDEGSLTVLIPVPRIEPPSLHGDLSPLRYRLRFSTPESPYSVTLRFAPGNELSPGEPEISVSPDSAVIGLAKAPGSRGHWRQWYCGRTDDSLEERLFLDEDNVNEFLEEVLPSPLTQGRSVAPPLIEVLEVTDEKIQIRAKLQECSDPDGLQGKEEGVSAGCPLSEKRNTEHPPTTDSDSPAAAEALATNTCGSAAGPQGICAADVPCLLSGKPQQLKAKLDPEFIKESSATCSAGEKENVKEPAITKGELNGDGLSSSLNKTVHQNRPDFGCIKETDMQDGRVQIIKDHTTHCAFSFQNSLLYDLD